MQTNYPVEYLARVVLEAVTPLSVSTGSPDGVFDSALVTDANGLPALPGTAIAGVLRSLWREQHAEREGAIFGCPDPDEGHRSTLDVSWGVLLDSRGRAVEGLQVGAAGRQRLADPLLEAARGLADQPCTRERVRLGPRGTAADTGKFDRAVLPAGFRFAFELRWRTSAPDEAGWQALLNLLAHPALRLGGGTRTGLGRVRPVTLHQAGFDRREPSRAEAWRGLERSLDAVAGLEAYVPSPAAVQDWLGGILHLSPRGPWRIGQGDREVAELKGQRSDKPADLLQVVEPRVRWRDGRGTLDDAEPALLLPASALKGALRHRFAYHANRLLGRWAEDGSTDGASPQEAALFGEINVTDGGQLGCLVLDDVFVDPEAVKAAQVMHNSIDRFTGGVRDRVLFAEESLWGGEFAVPVLLDGARLARHGHENEVRRALQWALDDLCQGRLGLGSRTTSGNGFMRGHLEGALAAWLEGNESQEQAA